MAERYDSSNITIAELVGCFTCNDCGSVVRDIEQHDEWHERLVIK